MPDSIRDTSVRFAFAITAASIRLDCAPAIVAIASIRKPMRIDRRILVLLFFINIVVEERFFEFTFAGKTSISDQCR
jgi:hypothetical protein